MKRYGKVFFILIVLVFSLNCSNPSNSFTFVFMTDIHLQPELQADQGFAAAINKVNELSPDFVITGGDLIMDALGQSYERSETLYNMYKDISQNFRMPVYNTLGNHEVFGLYESSGISPQHADYGKKMYLKNMGYEHPYYSFDHQGWHFIILDGIGFTAERTYYGYVDSTQLAWLEKDLRAVAPHTPIVVSTHIPLTSVYGQFAKGATYGMSQGEVIVNARDVLQRFDNHNLKLVLQGHLHAVEHIRFRDRHFITGGAVSGEWWKGPRDGFPEGFVIINAQTNDFDWRYESFGWDAKKQIENE